MNLFQEISEKDREIMLSCLDAKKKNYVKGSVVCHRGDVLPYMGMVLTGLVHMVKDDVWGERTIIGMASAGKIFGETYACIPEKRLEVDVIAAEDTEVLFLDIRRVLKTCSSACEFHTKLIRNLLSVMAEKNLMLTQKMEHMSKKNTREKLLSYLSMEAHRAESMEFQIPFNRQQMADYLAVDRSAMSRELCRMQEEGLLEFKKNRFRLYGGTGSADA
ncbi:MAG: Crp/Fnr family transcriptional regulator [Clostridiales bacterium]|nr:Crp/Fnr family transcriptional regulator [Clostridiales bacterium]